MGMQEEQAGETIRAGHGQVEKDEIHLPPIARQHLENLVDRPAGDQIEVRQRRDESAAQGCLNHRVVIRDDDARAHVPLPPPPVRRP